jgi:isocitrate dehydrogenase
MYDNPRAGVLAQALDKAIGRFLENNKSPARKVGEIDNRGSHFYLAMYWARALADQKDDAELAAIFGKLADKLEADEDTIVGELNGAQGRPVDLGGYYRPDMQKVSAAMRPSAAFNAVLQTLRQTG